MKNNRGTDLLPWILVGLSAVIMGVAVGAYSSDASADTAQANVEPLHSGDNARPSPQRL